MSEPPEPKPGDHIRHTNGLIVVMDVKQIEGPFQTMQTQIIWRYQGGTSLYRMAWRQWLEWMGY